MNLVKSKRIKNSILIFIVSFFIITLAGVKLKSFGRPLLALNHSDYYYFGDLYELTKLLRFKEKLLVNKEFNNSDIKDADIITMGDSFFEANYFSPKVPTELAKRTWKKVHHVKREDFLAANDNPLAYLKKIGYTKGDKKYLVLETVERYALERSVTYINDSTAPVDYSGSSAGSQRTYKIKNLIEPAYLQYFFYNNWLVAPFNVLGKNFRFELLNELPQSAPVAAKELPMLFYYEDVNFNKVNAPDEYVNLMAKNVKSLRDTLLDRYNLELIYVNVPTKYSIYGYLDKNFKEYNNFIPKTYAAIAKNNVNTFDLYSLYRKEENIEEDLLYYGGDSHFTPRAKNILVNEILRYIK